MKRVFSALTAIGLALGITLLSGCVEQQFAGLGAPDAPPVSSADTSPADANAAQPEADPGSIGGNDWYIPDLGGVPARKLMQAEFAKVYGYAPERMDSYYTDVSGENKKFLHEDTVPQQLIDALESPVCGGDTDSFVSAHSAGKSLSEDEVRARVGSIDTEDDRASVRGILADADNDGTDDIVALLFYGGTGGFSDLAFYKGTPDGFELTDTLSCINYNYSVISFDGKNYISQDALDYNTKYRTGVDLYCCKDGKFTDGVSAVRKAADYDVETTFDDAGYEGIDTVHATLLNKKMPDILAAHDNVIFGTAEDVIEEFYHFRADIDNDGVPEEYYKKIFYPSNTGTRMVCLWDYIDENGDYTDPDHANDPVQKILDADDSLAETIYTFWLDKVGSDNVLYIYTDNEDKFVLSAYIVG